MNVSDALVEWREFYSAVAEAGGALLGLVFVAITIQLDRRPGDLHARTLGMGAILALLHPLLASLTMLLPVAPLAQGVALLVIATSGLIGTVQIASFETRHPGGESRFASTFRYFLPLAAEALLMVAAVAFMIDSQFGVYAVPVFMTLMFIVGTQDAVDLLLGSTVGIRPGRDLFGFREGDVTESSGRENARTTT